MKIWLPYLRAGTGSDVSTYYLAKGLRERGHQVFDQGFSRRYELAPWLLRTTPQPRGCDVTITNTWNGFAFARKGIPMVTVDRLGLFDPTLNPYKSKAQRIYHNLFVRQFIRRSARAASQVVAVSERTADVFAQQFDVPRPKVILNAVDTDFFSPPERTRRIEQNQTRRLLYVGTLSRRKGVDLLSSVMRSLGDAYELYYTGSADAPIFGKDRLPNMHALGRLDQDAMREEYRKAHALLFPSRGEGLARAIMESLACGTPVAAANISSMPEAVNEQVGRLCPPDDVTSFAAAIKDLTTDDPTWQQYSRAARQRAEERFCLNRLLDEFEVLLTGLVEK